MIETNRNLHSEKIIPILRLPWVGYGCAGPIQIPALSNFSQTSH